MSASPCQHRHCLLVVLDSCHPVGTNQGMCHQVAHTSSSFEGNTAASPVAMLRNDSQSISKAAARQLKEKSLKARSGILVLLKELALVLPEQIPKSLSQLIPGIQQALQVNVPASLRRRRHQFSFSFQLWTLHACFKSPGESLPAGRY